MTSAHFFIVLSAVYLSQVIDKKISSMLGLFFLACALFVMIWGPA